MHDEAINRRQVAFGAEEDAIKRPRFGAPRVGVTHELADGG